MIMSRQKLTLKVIFSGRKWSSTCKISPPNYSPKWTLICTISHTTEFSPRMPSMDSVTNMIPHVEKSTIATSITAQNKQSTRTHRVSHIWLGFWPLLCFVSLSLQPFFFFTFWPLLYCVSGKKDPFQIVLLCFLTPLILCLNITSTLFCFLIPLILWSKLYFCASSFFWLLLPNLMHLSSLLISAPIIHFHFHLIFTFTFGLWNALIHPILVAYIRPLKFSILFNTTT